jgi:hypothetical protein
VRIESCIYRVHCLLGMYMYGGEGGGSELFWKVCGVGQMFGIRAS